MRAPTEAISASLAPATRIEPRHRLVEDHQLRLVDQRLRDADALQHALRELAQLQAPLGADADLVEQAGGARRARGTANAEEARVVHEQLLGGQVIVEV